MRPANAPQSFPWRSFQPAERPASLKAVRVLIWVYLVLLVIEGTIRKWVVPQFSDPLLIIRDPVVLAIYFFALEARVFPRNGYVVALGIIGALSVIVSIFVLFDYVPFKLILLVSLYGFRCKLSPLAVDLYYRKRV